ncbi:restriction endonuclease subunit S [Halomonas sp. M20]|uniref:restriction endonuclease subunit S n=1 Tax=Halomonas sp. M20 TaxID=2763264 RepID=UPI001D0ACEFB|nr:restriction endonuclease subunit S [Halomonas sp. M20]
MFEWEHGSLGELANGVRGVSYTPNQLQSLISPETVILLRSNNIRDGKVNFDNIQLIPSHIVSKGQLAKHDDIAVCMSNGSKALVGKSGRIVGNAAPCTVGAFCSIFRPFPHADGKFVSYILQSNAYRRHLDIILAGSAINNLKNSDVEALPLEIPPKEEQRLIARILDTLDTQIQKTEALIAKLEKVKEGLLHDLLTRGIDDSGRLRPSPEQAPELYKESVLGPIPKSWDISTVGEVAEPLVGPAFESSRFTGSSQGVRLLRGLNVTRGRVRWEESKTERWPSNDPSVSRYALNEGDIVVGMDGALVGKNKAILTGEDVPSLLVQRVIRLRSNPADGTYLYMNICSDRFLSHIDNVKTHTAIPHITSGNVCDFIVPSPPPQEVERVTKIYKSLEKKTRVYRSQLSKLSADKAGLMDDLLTGRVRVTPLLDQAQATSPA